MQRDVAKQKEDVQCRQISTYQQVTAVLVAGLCASDRQAQNGALAI